MITKFKHKGLKNLYYKGDASKVIASHKGRLLRQLDQLEASVQPNDMNLPGWGYHKLTGDRKDTYSVSVSGNWRLTFRFEGRDATDVDYEDYH